MAAYDTAGSISVICSENRILYLDEVTLVPGFPQLAMRGKVYRVGFMLQFV